MATWIKWSIRLAVALLLVAESVAVTLFAVAVQPRPAVPLTAHLSGEWAKVSLEFDRSVRNRFAVGSSEEAMTLELRRQGFVRDDWKYAISDKQEAIATRNEGNFICNQAAMVYWRSDTAGHITVVRGEYRELGCL